MNKVILMGRLAADPELRYTQGTNKPVCTFRIAVNRRNSKESEIKADFFSIVTWNKTAEFCSKYFKKGQQIALTGSLRTSQYEDKDGKTTYKTDVVADEVYFADTRKEEKEEKVENLGTIYFEESLKALDELPF